MGVMAVGARVVAALAAVIQEKRDCGHRRRETAQVVVALVAVDKRCCRHRKAQLLVAIDRTEDETLAHHVYEHTPHGSAVGGRK